MLAFHRMHSVVDIARYLLDSLGPVSGFKLQKLVYYSHAYSIVWRNRELFPEPIKAWENGPVIPELYAHHKGRHVVQPNHIPGNPSLLPDWAKLAVDDTVHRYGNRPAKWLVEQTHNEQPWVDARQTNSTSPRITTDAIRDFYSEAGFAAPQDLDGAFARFAASQRTFEAAEAGYTSLEEGPTVPADQLDLE